MDEQQLRRIIRQEIRTIIRRKLQAFKRFRYRRLCWQRNILLPRLSSYFNE